MNNKLALSITMTSVITFNSSLAFSDALTEVPIAAKSNSQHGGKCAAGKCGTEKRFEKQELKDDPQGRLVRARDGKCGMTGEGISPSEETIKLTKSKITGGLCGQ
ncbi:hypothetical protein [Vibrio sagamiensis]|uniref:Uncharacterized protein n=1 Tax=Vibrio sagamiensis NBRC 104589 TaxID=1219064 RepID=A0A511QCD4_9VIBR|nr:hypothetical protein [Vibrio sagamiensis]PNQ58981.1 hypothetical protein C1141_12660 [Vibrio agarivorans]GEM74955.1 hypothetical protein VSA01S_10670 [Vibrio sagamiensis NBRC 104589]